MRKVSCPENGVFDKIPCPENGDVTKMVCPKSGKFRKGSVQFMGYSLSLDRQTDRQTDIICLFGMFQFYTEKIIMHFFAREDTAKGCILF